MFVKNVTQAVIMLDGKIMIAPAAVIEVADDHVGAKDLLQRGKLAKAEAPAPAQEEQEAEAPAPKGRRK